MLQMFFIARTIIDNCVNPFQITLLPFCYKLNTFNEMNIPLCKMLFYQQIQSIKNKKLPQTMVPTK